MTLQKRIRVAIVEDNRKLRLELADTIAAQPQLECVVTCASAEEALKQLPPAAPDVVLMDIHLQGMSGIECTRQLKQRLPDTQIVMLTMFDDAEKIFSALRSGASGYLLKRFAPVELLPAIEQAYHGGSPMTPQIARQVVKAFQDDAQGPKPKAAGETDQLAALGDGLATIPKELAPFTGLVVGSGQFGTEPAQGQIAELAVFSGRKRMQQIMGNLFGLSVDWEIGIYYSSLSKTAALGPISAEEIAARKAWAEKRKAERAALGLEEIEGGPQLLRLVGSTTECVTNSPLYITDTVAVFVTNSGWTVQKMFCFSASKFAIA